MSRTMGMRAKLAAQLGLPALSLLGAGMVGTPAVAGPGPDIEFTFMHDAKAWAKCADSAAVPVPAYSVLCFQAEDGTVIRALDWDAGDRGPEDAYNIPLGMHGPLVRVLNGSDENIHIGAGDASNAPANAASGNEDVIGPGGEAVIYRSHSRDEQDDSDDSDDGGSYCY